MSYNKLIESDVKRIKTMRGSCALQAHCTQRSDAALRPRLAEAGGGQRAPLARPLLGIGAHAIRSRFSVVALAFRRHRR